MLMFLHRKGLKKKKEKKKGINRAGAIEKQVGESVTLSFVLRQKFT